VSAEPPGGLARSSTDPARPLPDYFWAIYRGSGAVIPTLSDAAPFSGPTSLVALATKETGMLGWPFVIGLLQGFVFVMLLLTLATS
jgi:hypothetical protein